MPAQFPWPWNSQRGTTPPASPALTYARAMPTRVPIPTRCQPVTCPPAAPWWHRSVCRGPAPRDSQRSRQLQMTRRSISDADSLGASRLGRVAMPPIALQRPGLHRPYGCTLCASIASSATVRAASRSAEARSLFQVRFLAYGVGKPYVGDRVLLIERRIGSGPSRAPRP